MFKEEAFTTYQIATYCAVSPRTVAQWIHDGKLNAYRTPGNHSRIKKEDFLKFLKRYNMPIPKDLRSKDRKDFIKLLIVDDDKNMAKSIERCLILEGKYKIELAFDGFDAGRKVVLFEPDLVILDIKMPGMDGYEVTKRIKEIPENFHTKIIAISAFFDEKGKEKIISLGADQCLDKPFNKEDLLSVISIVLGRA